MNRNYLYCLELIVKNLEILGFEKNPDIWLHDLIGDREFCKCLIVYPNYLLASGIYIIHTNNKTVITQLSLTPKALWIHFGSDSDTIDTSSWYTKDDQFKWGLFRRFRYKIS